MPRKNRIVIANHPHHIVQRGHNRNPVFLSANDRLSYLETLRDFRVELELRVYEYLWSSYRAHAGLSVCHWLDPDPCYLALGDTPAQRGKRYGEFVAQGIEATELEFIRDAVKRNELTASEEFTEAIERRTGQRFSNRKPGSPIDT